MYGKYTRLFTFLPSRKVLVKVLLRGGQRVECDALIFRIRCDLLRAVHCFEVTERKVEATAVRVLLARGLALRL